MFNVESNASLVTVMVPLTVPVPVGVKLTPRFELPPAVITNGNVGAVVKENPVPEIEICEIVTLWFSELFRETLPVEVCPIPTAGRLNDEGWADN